MLAGSARPDHLRRPAAATLIGVPTSPLLGTQLWAAVPWLNDPVYEDRYRAALLSQQSTSFVALRPPGDWLSFRLYPSRTGLSVRVGRARPVAAVAPGPAGRGRSPGGGFGAGGDAGAGGGVRACGRVLGGGGRVLRAVPGRVGVGQAFADVSLPEGGTGDLAAHAGTVYARLGRYSR
ncbi:hypothetical protein GCM10020295_73690 [Streptomyces cinereospinus]